MRLELPVRWNETDKEAEKFNEIVKGEGASAPVKYTYGKLSIDSEDIGPYYEIDDRHIMINDMNGKMYCVAVPFHEFKKIFTEVTGKAILSVQTSEEYKSSKPRKRRDNNLDDIDDILNN